MARLRAWKAALVNEAVALDHAPRHHQHQAEIDVGRRLRDDGRDDRDRNLSPGRLGNIDVVRRDRLRGDGAQLRIGCDHVAIDPVVQERKQNVAFAYSGDERLLGNDAARVRIDLDARDPAQALDRAAGDRLGDEDAWAHQAIHRTTPATPSTATCEPSGMRLVASSTPSTIGMPRSRASEARCEVEPPSSATTPATRGSTWLSAGPATFVTSTSPGATRDSSHSQFTTTARPEPQPMPAGWPLRPGCASQISSGTTIGSTCSGRACRSLKPLSSSAHSISTGMPKMSSALRSRRPSATAWPASRQGLSTMSFGTACGTAPSPCPQVSR